MGSPVPVMVANPVMEDVEDRVLDDTCMHVCLALAANECELEAFLGHLKLVEPTIQFSLARGRIGWEAAIFGCTSSKEIILPKKRVVYCH